MTVLYDWEEALREDGIFFVWTDLVSEWSGYRLVMNVTEDAIIDTNGLRQPATAQQMQRIADALGAMLPTPKLLDLVWQQAAVRFDCVVNIKGKIVADCTVGKYNEAVEAAIRAAGGHAAGGGIVASVGKYWVLSNALAREPKELHWGKATAANYGWHSHAAPADRRGVLGGDVRVWQSLGTMHNDEHADPSQVVRLVERAAFLYPPDNGEPYDVDVLQLAADAKLWPLVNHDGPLRYLRQASVPEPQPVKNADGSVTVPEIKVYGRSPE